MQYQLAISIDGNGLQSIYAANMAVTICKQIIVGGNISVGWLNFQPLEENVVSWVENYSFYATTTQLVPGATIMQISNSGAPVQPGWNYVFAQGQFTGGSGGASGTYNLRNQQQGNPLGFGLAQQASVNNVPVMAPLNAVPIPDNQSASFTPTETVSVFLSSASNNGVVLDRIASNALVVTLNAQSPSAQIGFNDATNTFYLYSSEQFSAHDYARRLQSKVSRALPRG